MQGDMGGMSMPLLPAWLRFLWVAVVCVVAVVHIGHAWAMPGQRRWWHIGHTLMAGGMALMYALPRMQHPVLYRAGPVVFVVLAVTVTGAALYLRRREGALNPLWVFSAVDMVVMTYMLLPVSHLLPAVSYLLVAYLSVQFVAWMFGLWDRLPVFRNRIGAHPGGSRAPSSEATDGGSRPTLLPADSHPEASTGPVVELTAHSSLAVHITLAVMAASMAYMLAVM